MDLSLIIVSYKTKGLLKYCLKDIYQTAPSCSFEIIVVDNQSGDGTPEMIKKNFPKVKCLIPPKNIGFAAGNNLGLQVARGKYIVILNPDIVALPKALEAMIFFLEKNPEVGLVGPQLINPDKSIQLSCARFPTIMTPLYRRTPLGRLKYGQTALARYLMTDYDHQTPKEVPWLLGACLMAPKRVIAQVGLLDERFFLYFEDVDWCRRFWQKGYKVIYLPQSRLVHFHQRLSVNDTALGSLFSSATRAHIISGIKYFWKYRWRVIPKCKN